MKYYIVTSGRDCDGTPVSPEDVLSGPYTTYEDAALACEKMIESSDGFHHAVMNEEQIVSYDPDYWPVINS